MNRRYQPVPIPFKQRLREARVRLLPLLVFVAVGIAVYHLWTDQVSSPGLIGEVVADHSSVSSPQNGILINFYYDRFDMVEEGQLIGQIMQKDSLVLHAELDVIRSEIELIREGLEPVTDEQRNRINLEDLKIEEIQTRISLARTELEQQQVMADYNRIAELRKRDLVSEQEYELAKTELDLLDVQVDEYRELVGYLGDRIGEIEEFTGYTTRTDRDPVMAAIRVQEQRMESVLAQSAPIPLYAPISGIISDVLHKQGEYVNAGASILQIESKEPAYIVGYVRQPFTVEPHAGMEVQVRTRKPGRDFFTSRIDHLGGHMRLIEDNLQRPGAIYESGLPVRIAITETDEINLTPGEIVDIVLRP
jgi:multidrug resistance efflux pump